MSTEASTHIHSDDHPGCRALWPWLPGCNRYRLNVDLVATATEDVAGMPGPAREEWLKFFNRPGRRGHSRWHVRSKYIAHRENWSEDDRAINLAETASLAKILGDKLLKGRTVEQAAEDSWRLKLQRHALEVLHTYRAPLPTYDPAKAA